MQPPKLHIKAEGIEPFLPRDHWLLPFMEEHVGDGHSRLICAHCGWDVYTADEGTLFSWIETGYVFRDHVTGDHPEGEPEAGVFHLYCYAHLEDYSGPSHTATDTDPRMLLNDDGSPQEIEEPANSPLRDKPLTHEDSDD